MITIIPKQLLMSTSLAM